MNFWTSVGRRQRKSLHKFYCYTFLLYTAAVKQEQQECYCTPGAHICSRGAVSFATFDDALDIAKN